MDTFLMLIGIKNCVPDGRTGQRGRDHEKSKSPAEGLVTSGKCPKRGVGTRRDDIAWNNTRKKREGVK